MSEQQNAAHARELLEAFRRGDIEAVLALFDPRVEIFSSPELANPGRFVGREGYLEWSAQWLDVWETFEIEEEAIEPIGSHHVLVSVRQHGKGKDSGVEVEMRACYMAEVHNGMATRFHLYPNRDKALEAAREGESR